LSFVRPWVCEEPAHTWEPLWSVLKSHAKGQRTEPNAFIQSSQPALISLTKLIHLAWKEKNSLFVRMEISLGHREQNLSGIPWNETLGYRLRKTF
jgi:hypothetical protein